MHISHELKAPLISIETSIKMVLDEKATLDPQLAHFLDLAARNTKRLRGVVSDIMAVKVLSRGQVKLNKISISFETFINDLFCQIMPWAKEKAVLLAKEGNESISIVGDEEWLNKAVLSVLGNAVKFTQTGGRVVINSSYDSDWLTIKISDTGCGINKDKLAKIFELFEQSQETPPEGESSGIGLGLTLAKQVVELHGGKIEVDSELDKGSTFSILLPLKKYDEKGDLIP